LVAHVNTVAFQGIDTLMIDVQVSVDLIYLDPPFNSNATYNVLFRSPKGEKSQAQIEAFEDTWHWTRSHLDNGNAPQEPALSESEKADTRAFLNEILQILPLVGLQAFEFPKPVATPGVTTDDGVATASSTQQNDTIIVPARLEGFERVFLGENCWYAIRISGEMLSKIKYIAAYQSQPISAITHYAPVDHIEPYGEGGKYKVVFSEPAKQIGPIPYGDATSGAMQGPRYTNIEKLKAAKKLTDLMG